MTWSRATTNRGNGSAIIRLRSVMVASSAASRSTGAAAWGLAAATFVKGANSSPIARA
nr:hypothetical protein [Candidatus Frankia alpina]